MTREQCLQYLAYSPSYTHNSEAIFDLSLEDLQKVVDRAQLIDLSNELDTAAPYAMQIETVLHPTGCVFSSYNLEHLVGIMDEEREWESTVRIRIWRRDTVEVLHDVPGAFAHLESDANLRAALPL